MGTIKIKTHDGAIRTFPNVLYVPDLKHNLISLGTLELEGCKYSAGYVVLNVLEGTQIMLMGSRQGGLYVQQGCTIKCFIIASPSSPGDIFSYLCHIWSDYVKDESPQK